MFSYFIIFLKHCYLIFRLPIDVCPVSALNPPTKRNTRKGVLRRMREEDSTPYNGVRGSDYEVDAESGRPQLSKSLICDPARSVPLWRYLNSWD